MRRLTRLYLRRQELRARSQQQPRHDEYDGTLNEAEHQEGMLVSRRVDHGFDRPDRDGSTRAESGGRNSGGQSTPAGKPLERVTDTGAVDTTRADAAERGSKIQNGERTRAGIQYPCRCNQNRAHDDDPARPESIDQVTFNRNEPGFDQNEECERDLNGGTAPVILGVDGIDE